MIQEQKKIKINYISLKEDETEEVYPKPMNSTEIKNSISIEDNGRSLKEIFGSNITFKNKEEFINEEESNNEIGQINNNNEKEKIKQIKFLFKTPFSG